MSLRSSPDTFGGQDGLHSGCVSPLQLPATPFPVSPLPLGQNSMSEALQSKSPGLIRRLSGRAARKLVGPRQSSNNIRNRDQASGPLVTRKRSGSKTGYESDLAANEGYSTLDELDISSLDSLSLNNPSTPASAQASIRKISQMEDSDPPVISADLLCGTRLTKVSRRGKKQIHLVLDPQDAKVTWNSLNKRIYIDDIQALRIRGEAQNIRDDLSVSAEYENRWLTIVYADNLRSKGRPTKEMNLIFPPDEGLFEKWTVTLAKLYRYRRDLIAGLAGPGLDENTLRSRWNQEMSKVFQGRPRATAQEVLDFNGVESVCRSLNINWSTKTIQEKFDSHTNGSRGLNYEQFRAFVKDVKVRADVLKIFQRIEKQHAAGMTMPEFLTFLQVSQGVSVAAEPHRWERVFYKFVQDDQKHHKTQGAEPIMDFSAFNAFLSSADNNVLCSGPIEKLDRPLNEYFISSSHNTYLLGRQWAGSSSTEGYIRALQAGCRCVEIDCWDGNADYEHQPIVTHGRTKTSSIRFAECIEVISKYAFNASPCPLILSLEVHCCAAQQEVMVRIMERELGDRLVKQLIDPMSDKLPSPESLLGKILIKAKTGTSEPTREVEAEARTTSHTRHRSISSPAAQQQLSATLLNNADTSFVRPVCFSSMGKSSPSTPVTTETPRISSSSDDSEIGMFLTSPTNKQPKHQKRKIVDSLDKLCIYTRGLKFHDFTSEETKKYNHIFSLSDRTFDKLCRNSVQSSRLDNHNIGCLMRIYPNAKRVSSSNFNPLACWRRGVQMAALNYQTYDMGMQLNDAMFGSISDRRGYVLKPRGLRPLEGIPEHIKETLKPKYLERIQFQIQVISAQVLSRPRWQSNKSIPSPYIEVQVFIPDDTSTGSIQSTGGHVIVPRDKPGLCRSVRHWTKVVPSNGYDPSFDNRFMFSVTTKHPELIFVRWSVWNSNDAASWNNNEGAKPEATFTAKLTSLQTGLRHIPLRNHLGEQYTFSTIFCEIVKGQDCQVPFEERNQTEDFSLWEKAGQAFGIKRRASSEK